MISEIPEKGQLIDYKHTTYDYVACLVENVKDSQMILREMDGKIPHTFNAEFQKLKVKPFRTESKVKKENYYCYTKVKNLSTLNYEKVTIQIM